MGLKLNVKKSLAALACVALVVSLTASSSSVHADSDDNLLENGGFERGTNDKGEPRGWHTRMTSFTTIPEYTDPANKKGRTGRVFFRDGSGHEWGTTRPWAMLRSPKSGHVITGLEDSAAYYEENHESVSLGSGRNGKGVHFNMSEVVGNNQGARVFSHLVKANSKDVYVISFDAVSKAPHLRVFVEGFKLEKINDEDKALLDSLPEGANVYNIPSRLKRVYRKQINCETPGSWKHFEDAFAAPSEQYGFDYLMVNLYAFLPGEAAYDNVVLRKATKREAEAYRDEKPKKKQDSKYRY